jgi:hypothetical protein
MTKMMDKFESFLQEVAGLSATEIDPLVEVELAAR